MAYFIFEIRHAGVMQCVDAFESYRDARKVARERRAALEPNAPISVRMIFAADEAQAERLLREKREARPLGEEA